MAAVLSTDETVSAYEAKTHLAQLLDRVSKGARIHITRYGTEVAVLTPPEKLRKSKKSIDQIIEEIEEFGSHHSLGGDSLKDYIEEGRD